jgi:hypothetical protein
VSHTIHRDRQNRRLFGKRPLASNEPGEWSCRHVIDYIEALRPFHAHGAKIQIAQRGASTGAARGQATKKKFSSHYRVVGRRFAACPSRQHYTTGLELEVSLRNPYSHTTILEYTTLFTTILLDPPLQGLRLDLE